MYYFGYSIIHETYVMIGCQLLNVVFSHFLYSILILQGTANKLTCQTCMATALQQCFLLAISDDLGSATKWYATERMYYVNSLNQVCRTH